MTWLLAHLDTIIILAALIVVEHRITQNQVKLARFLEAWRNDWYSLNEDAVLAKAVQRGVAAAAQWGKELEKKP